MAKNHDLPHSDYYPRSTSCITFAIAFVKDKVKDLPPPSPVRDSGQIHHLHCYLSLLLPFYPCEALKAFVPSAYNIAEAFLAVIRYAFSRPGVKSEIRQGQHRVFVSVESMVLVLVMAMTSTIIAPESFARMGTETVSMHEKTRERGKE
ncbi:hypothetical protein PM082_018467 [Marasmius tenuissimus]|nr:hypothetical protein PM082_018467 [Marasmius tenuissimus]